MATEDIILRATGAAMGGAILGLLVALVIKVLRRAKTMPKWPLVTFAALAAVTSLALHAEQESDVASDVPEPTVVRQPAQGLTEAVLTPEYAGEIREHLVNGLRENLPLGSGAVVGRSANVMFIGERRIGVIRIAIGDTSLVSIFGLRDGDLVRVTCSGGDERTDYRAPECASAVRQHLGVNLP